MHTRQRFNSVDVYVDAMRGQALVVHGDPAQDVQDPSPLGEPVHIGGGLWGVPAPDVVSVQEADEVSAFRWLRSHGYSEVIPLDDPQADEVLGVLTANPDREVRLWCTSEVDRSLTFDDVHEGISDLCAEVGVVRTDDVPV